MGVAGERCVQLSRGFNSRRDTPLISYSLPLHLHAWKLVEREEDNKGFNLQLYAILPLHLHAWKLVEREEDRGKPGIS